MSLINRAIMMMTL